MRLTDYLEPELVVLDLDTVGVEDTLRRLATHLTDAGRVPDTAEVTAALLRREESHTTSLGNGVALPHATLDRIERPLILVATAPDGIRFGPDRDGQQHDRLFFLLLSPADAAGTHIKMLARIVRLVRAPAFVERLVAADTAEGLVAEVAREDGLHV